MTLATTSTDLRQPDLAPALSPTRPAWEVSCLNCDSPLAGPFCAECGQRAVPPHPRVSELAGDAFAEFSGWDGKFAETIRLLVRRPGELTKQFIAGRRVRFISPVRLYLAMSFVYFVLAGAASQATTRPGELDLGGIRISSSSNEPSAKMTAVTSAETAARAGTLSAAQRDSALASIASAPRIIRPILVKGIEDPKGLQQTMIAYMPRVFFALLPVFAAILAIFYKKRHYPEHLYFAIHLHAFAFFALTFIELAKLAHLTAAAKGIGTVAMVWICGYAIVALRRVYGGSIGKTLLKGAGIGSLYLLASGTALMVLVYAAAVLG